MINDKITVIVLVYVKKLFVIQSHVSNQTVVYILITIIRKIKELFGRK